jgi:anti-anti-sigma factor
MINEIKDTIYFTIQPEDIVIIKVEGRGNFKNSLSLKQLSEQLIKDGKKPRYIIDLKNCISMDSTFMGVLASIGKNQMKMSLGKTIVINLNKQTESLLKTLGLNFILDIKETSLPISLPSDNNFVEKKAEPLNSKIEQIIHMLQAHQTLIDLDTQNEARFQDVIIYLQNSLIHKQKISKNTVSGEEEVKQ